MEETYGSPRGECYRWSNYVACELLELGPIREVWLSTGDLVLGKLRFPHSWVEVGGWVVDITADQFNAIAPRRLPAAWVKPCTARTLSHLVHQRRRIRAT